jgi:pimeloyl-ACP methyl ester carboxylesterase
VADSVIEKLELKIGERQAHYLKAGSGPPVVLIHGGASDSNDWIETMVPLSDSYTLYAPDMLGYGKPSGWTQNPYASWVTPWAEGYAWK